MTRAKAVNEYVIPALKNTWNEKVCAEVINALGQADVFDKIRAEIENVLSDGMIHKQTVLGIIDKYKAESEG